MGWLPIAGFILFFFVGPPPYAIAGLLLVPMWLGLMVWVTPYVTSLEPADPTAT